MADYPPGTNPALKAGPDYSGDPTLAGGELAVWPVIVREGQQARDVFIANIENQVPTATPLDEDQAGIARDKAQRATLKSLDLRNTPDEDLGSFDPALDAQDLDGAYVAKVQAAQLQTLLAVDDQLVNISSTLAYDPTERSAVEASLSATLVSASENKRPSTPPAAAREGVRVPDETVDKLLVERAEFPGPWPGHWLTATLWTDDATEGAAARFTPYTETGTPLGTYPFVDNGDGTWTLSTQSSEGQRTAEPRILQYEFLYGTGSASVIRRQTLTVAQQARDHKARYGAPA